MPTNPAVEVRLPAFWLDQHEVTVGDFLANRDRPPNPNAPEIDPKTRMMPQTKISWDQAVHCCENIGKRLPNEWEFEFAASRGGKQSYPWGEEPPQRDAWTISPVGQPSFDRLPDLPVQGLYSNALEWTASWALGNPRLQEWADFDDRSPQSRVVKGGPRWLLVSGEPPARTSEGDFNPRSRVLTERRTWHPSLGFRCARSVKPRLKPEDFARFRTPGSTAPSAQ